uniref:Uncharacterized protein n=1 Tax=Anopheles atroparvus TaxID=41427 RepID=A0AAG5DGY8_ANOAO
IGRGGRSVSLDVRVEARPVADLVEEGVTGAGGGDGLTVPDEPVVGGDVTERDAAADELLGGVAGGRVRDAVGERADHAHADRAIVVAGCVRSLASPAAALVRGAVLADQEVVTDVGPAVGVHVEVLDVAHLRGAGGVRRAVSSGRVVHHDPRGRSDRQLGGVGGTRSPLRTGYDARALGRHAGQAGHAGHQQYCGELVHPVGGTLAFLSIPLRHELSDRRWRTVHFIPTVIFAHAAGLPPGRRLLPYHSP